MSNKQTLKRTKSDGHLENYILSDLQHYLDKESENKIKKLLGNEYIDGIRLYKFPIQKCKELKAYKLLEENKSHEIKKLLEYIKTRDSKQIFHHSMNQKIDDLFKKNLDFNALSIISYKLAEKFANDNGKFKIGKLKDTELAEFHTYVTNKLEKKLGELDRHEDDRAGVTYNTITLIWFLIKDKKIDGGNISFYKNSYSQDEKKVTINLWDQIDGIRENCVCLIFKGDIEHGPEEISGLGERSSIVFQFERIDDEEGKGEGKRKKKVKTRRGKKRTRRK